MYFIIYDRPSAGRNELGDLTFCDVLSFANINENQWSSSESPSFPDFTLEFSHVVHEALAKVYSVPKFLMWFVNCDCCWKESVVTLNSKMFIYVGLLVSKYNSYSVCFLSLLLSLRLFLVFRLLETKFWCLCWIQITKGIGRCISELKIQLCQIPTVYFLRLCCVTIVFIVLLGENFVFDTRLSNQFE